LSGSRFQRLALLLAVLAAAHGLVYVPIVERNFVTDSATYVAAAEAILDGSYSTPLIAGFYFDTTRTLAVADNVDLTGLRIDLRAWHAPERQAFRPPGYPLVLAAVGGGRDGASQLAALVLQACLFGLGAWLLALTLRRWWTPRVALAVTAVYALDPWSKHYVALLMSEVPAGLLAIATAYAFTRAWSERAVAWWAAAGALAAALTLVRAVFVVAVPLLVLGALLRRAPARARVRDAAAVLASAAALLAPWLAWTSAVTGKPVLANWGEGYNFALAAYGEGLGRTQTEVADDPAFGREIVSTHRSAPSTRELLTDPEAHPRYLLRADEELRAAAWARYGERLADEPLQVAWEALYRAYFLWMAHEDWRQPSGLALDALSALDWLLLLVATAGAALGIARGGPPRGVALALVAYTAVLATHHVEARFALPLRGFYLAFAVLAVTAAVERLRRAPLRP
jgi:4-amino-4-deoxy-L-arabinose transferase-like glycosyltransferase